MSRWIRLLTTVTTAGLLCACEVGPFGLEGLNSRTVTITLSGTVTAAPGGDPVVGATVEDVGESVIGLFGFGVSVGSAVTDSLGHYTLRARCTDSCPALDFVAHLDGFERGLMPHLQTLRVIQSRDSVLTATLDFSLQPTRPITVAVHGQVTNGPSTLPEPNATVTVMEGFWPFQMDSTTTDSLGMYEMVAADHCAISDDSCFFGPIRVMARQGSRVQVMDFLFFDIPGDSLDLLADFDSLR